MKAPSMVLPLVEQSSGEVVETWDQRHDVRIPRTMRRPGEWSDEHPARAFAHHQRSSECPAGRHLLDVIESTIERELEIPDDDARDPWRIPVEELYEYDHRTVLTCVRCGLVTEWEGTRREKQPRRVIPAPLVVGDLAAQHVDGPIPHDGDRNTTTWSIHRAGQIVGVIIWARGQRGRAFHQARLYSWPQGQSVEGKDPLAALRAVARHEKAGAS